MAKVKVASVQAPSVLGDVAANVRRFSRLVTEAAKAGAKIVVLPEAALTGYASQDFKHAWCVPEERYERHFAAADFTGHDPAPVAQEKDGAIVTHFQKLCRDLRVYCTVPYVEKAPSTSSGAVRYYNSISLIAPDGSVAAHYRKTNLWPYYDNAWATAGSSIVTAETPYGRVGLGVCYDVHKVLPEYKAAGVWALLYCIAWVDDERFEWFDKHLPRILADEEIPYNIIGCNWSVDTNRRSSDADGTAACRPQEVEHPACEWHGFGKTTIYGPRGRILASTGDRYGDTIVYADVAYVPTD